ncbi:hypothetical protein ACHHYP_00669 [Achlya hypogyna]|uniref:Uncharacterized protein n=1 Tax=Achlya hypogyna TaxID=1202772 RepID=A0A1V9ZU72_ACHHY|nr:hypothetical protein ACHHYP_00669 [Achlya hypogyna]
MSQALLCNRDLLRTIGAYQCGIYEDIQPFFQGILALKAQHGESSRSGFMAALDAAVEPHLLALQAGLLGRLVRCLRAREFPFVMSCLVKFAVARGHVELLHNVHRRLSLHQCAHLVLQAAAYGQPRVLSYLRAISYPAWSPSGLIAATQAGHIACVRFFLAHYAPPCICQALTEAAKAGRVDIVEALYPHRHDHCPLNRAFDQAVSAGQLNVVRFFVASGEVGSGIALALAADHGHLPIVRFLHEHAGEPSGTVVMDLAAASGHVDVVAYLHAVGAGCTRLALQEAAAFGHKEVVAFLLAHRAEGSPRVAWQRAVRHGHEATAALLEPHIPRREQPRRGCKRQISSEQVARQPKVNRIV